MVRSIDGIITGGGEPPTTSVLFGSGTYVTPTGCKKIDVLCAGGGGSGAMASAGVAVGGGGGGGGWFRKYYDPGSYAFSVAATAASVNVAGFNGNNGGLTTFGPADSAAGGFGGLANGTGGAGGGWTVTGAYFTQGGGAGGGSPFTNNQCTEGGVGFWGFQTPNISSLDVSPIGKADGKNGAGGGGCTPFFARSGWGGAGGIIITEFY